MMEYKELAKFMHDQYELIALEENWDTQKKCKVEFDELPKANQQTMFKLAERVLKHIYTGSDRGILK